MKRKKSEIGYNELKNTVKQHIWRVKRKRRKVHAENCSYILIFHDYAIFCPERIKELFALRKKAK